MKVIKRAFFLIVVVLFCSGSVIASNMFILNKVKPEEGSPIYVQVSYTSAFLPLIPLKVSRELRYNDTMILRGPHKINWIRIRNAKNEVERIRIKEGQREIVAQRPIKSRVAHLWGDDRIKRECDNFLRAKNQKLRQRNKKPIPINRKSRKRYCFPFSFHFDSGARINKKNRTIVLDQGISAIPFSIAITRHPNGKDFVVTEVGRGTSLGTMFGRGEFFEYLKHVDLDKSGKSFK
jgi:hypothetical protein